MDVDLPRCQSGVTNALAHPLLDGLCNHQGSEGNISCYIEMNSGHALVNGCRDTVVLITAFVAFGIANAAQCGRSKTGEKALDGGLKPEHSWCFQCDACSEGGNQMIVDQGALKVAFRHRNGPPL